MIIQFENGNVKIKSECLKEALNEIDSSNDLIEIVISTEKEFFRLSSFGVIGDTHVNKLFKLNPLNRSTNKRIFLF